MTTNHRNSTVLYEIVVAECNGSVRILTGIAQIVFSTRAVKMWQKKSLKVL